MIERMFYSMVLTACLVGFSSLSPLPQSSSTMSENSWSQEIWSGGVASFLHQ